MNLADLFKQRLHHDPSSPLVTYYDESSGERIELSATSFANWVNKTANLIRDEMGLSEGEAIFLDLPLHWQSLVWVQAALQYRTATAGNGLCTGGTGTFGLFLRPFNQCGTDSIWCEGIAC